MLLYVTLGTNDLARPRAFYDPVLSTLGLSCSKENDREFGYSAGPDQPRQLWVTLPFDGGRASFGNGSMVALAAPSRAAVDAFHAAALAHGGTDEGGPGLRRYHPTVYAAYVREPVGNKLSAVCEKAE